MNASLPPDEMTTENELICEKLLGWKRLDREGPWKSGWYHENGSFMGEATPTFTTWSEAGPILEALAKDGRGPLAVRDAGLAFIQSKTASDLQARIDALMFEYCPDEMTTEQKERWAEHQQVANP